MNKTKELARDFIVKSTDSKNSFKESFEVPKHATIGISVRFDLTHTEETQIHNLLKETHLPSNITEAVVSEHFTKLVSISKQIKSISAQSILLHGERIQQAQELLKLYRDGAFTKWLMLTYGNRQTPYAMLRYYEFYKKAPTSMHPLIESMPKKAVYLLASVVGDTQSKWNLVKKHHTEKQGDLIHLIRETFSVEEKTLSKPASTAVIEELENICKTLEKRKPYLEQAEKAKIRALLKRFKYIIE